MSTNKILIVEEDLRTQRALTRIFEPEGYEIQIAEDGQTGLNAFRRLHPAMVILDLKLRVLSGKDVCKQMKEDAPSLPVLVLSARTDVTDKVVLFELGADDYVTKPFHPRELLARARAALRRTNRISAGRVLSFGNVRVDVVKMEITRAGQTVPMTAHEFKLLAYLLSNPKKVITRDEMLSYAWGYEKYSSSRTVDNYILKLRQKLEEDPIHPQHFQTVHGVGYKFVP